MNSKGPQLDYSTLGIPSTEYIMYNLQTLANHAQLNGGKIRVPATKPLPKLPWVSMVIHVYKEGYYEARIIPEEEWIAETSLKSGVAGKPVID